ncbi:MAG: hypothetical protein WD060_08855 [Pirellulales bacterium]
MTHKVTPLIGKRFLELADLEKNHLMAVVQPAFGVQHTTTGSAAATSGRKIPRSTIGLSLQRRMTRAVPKNCTSREEATSI